MRDKIADLEVKQKPTILNTNTWQYRWRSKQDETINLENETKPPIRNNKNSQVKNFI